jgi:hypothetical protein
MKGEFTPLYFYRNTPRGSDKLRETLTMSVMIKAGWASSTRAWLLAAPILGFSAHAAQAAKLLPGYFTGNASAAAADISTGVLSLQLTHLAQTYCPCAGTNGHTVAYRVGPVSIPGLVTTSVTIAKSLAVRTDTTADATESAQLETLSLLGGLVQANAIRAVASVHATTDNLKTNTDGSHFVKLIIAGKPVADSPPPNTIIALPGLGSVKLNVVTTSGNGTKAVGLQVIMLQVSITSTNSFGLPVGATLTIGEASVGYHRPQPERVVSGNANVLDTNAAAITALPGLGPLAPVAIDNCAGVPGKPSNAVSALTVGPISIGEGTTTAQGGQTGPKASMAQTTAQVGGISLLGLIGATAITSEATETVVGGKVTASAVGTSFAGLTVAGVPVPVSVPANTSIPLPLLGYVIVNEQTAPAAGHAGPITVNGLHVHITTANALNVPVGSEIIVAHATATAAKLPD